MPARKKQSGKPAFEHAIDPAIESGSVPDSPKSSSHPIQEDTITFNRTHFFAVLTVLSFAAGVLLGYLVWGVWGIGSASLRNTNQTPGSLVEAPEAQAAEGRLDIPTQNAYSIGPANAPITIVEFSDYQCPFCRRWHNEVYEPLLSTYPGKIRLVYRHFPLTQMHPDALSAAESAMCAGEQDAYWPYHEKLFSSESLGNSTYMQYARDLNLNMSTFETCLNDHKYQAVIQADANSAIDLGINATPTFFINGLRVVGAQPLEVFKQVIDKELAGEIPN